MMASVVAMVNANSLSVVVLRPLLLLVLLSNTLLFAQAETVTMTDTTTATMTSVLTSLLTSGISTTPTTPTPTTTTLTTVVSIFYLSVNGEQNGDPYGMFHHDTGQVIGVDKSATTFVVTATLTDMRPYDGYPQTSSMVNSTTKRPKWLGNQTASPSTITQGPSTFMFTGSNYGPNRTIVNQCELNGTSSASCSLTHVGAGWYTHDKQFSGTFSTYNYTWTSGDRFGFAPVTITAGVQDILNAPGSTSKNTGGMHLAVRAGEAYWLACTMAVMAAFVMGIFAVV